MKTAQASKKHAGSTQKFTEISDITDTIVLFTNGNACLVTEVQATNFSLLSQDEQAAKITAYGSLLNSLSFSIQILVRNKRVDITSYLKLLDAEAQKTANEKLSTQIILYREFVQEMVKVNTVLDKTFYIIIPYSPLEKGATQALKKEDNTISAQNALHAKADTLMAQFSRLSLGARVLEKEDLIKLFYEIYNHSIEQTSQVDQTYTAAVVQNAQEKKIK